MGRDQPLLTLGWVAALLVAIIGLEQYGSEPDKAPVGSAVNREQAKSPPALRIPGEVAR
jgi:hypothetical protein